MPFHRNSILALFAALLAVPALAGMDLHVSPYFSEFTGLQRLPSGPILAGTQGGVFASFDEGSTWAFTGLGSQDDPNAGNDVHFDAVELDDGTVYVVMENAYRADPGLGAFTRVAWPWGVEQAEASGDTIWAGGSDLIHRSLDRGATWTEVYAVPNNYDDLGVLRRNPVTGLLAMELLRPGGIFLVVSSDGGATWTERALGGVFGATFALRYTDDGTLWIGHNYLNRGYLRTSADDGLSTVLVYTAPSNRELGDLTHGPADRMAMTEGSYLIVSEDGGATYQQRNAGSPHPEPLFFTGGERLLAGTSDGLRISEDEGQSWTTSSEGLWANIMIDADVAPDGTAWILSSGRIWHDATGDWTRLPLPGGTGQQTHVLRATSSGRVLLLGSASGVPEGYYTDDDGAVWQPMAGLDGASSWSRWAGVTEHAGVLYAGHEGLGLFVSTDDGASWTLRSGTPRGRIDRAGDGRLWSSGTLGLHVSADDGFTWTPVGALAPVMGGAASPVTGSFVVPDLTGLHVTTDGGVTWTDIINNAWNALGADNLWLSGVQSLAYTGAGELLVAFFVDNNATYRKETRLALSTDDGATFIEATGDGGFHRAVSQTLERSAEGMVVACTNQGLFGDGFTPDVALDDPQPGDGGAPAALVLGRNRPNPFNPRTEIPFTLERPGRVRLTVTDLRGRRVATLVDRPLAAGAHAVPFDGARLESGVYLYRLETEAGVRSGKMSLVK